MEQENKKTWKEKFNEWYENNKDVLLVGGIWIGTLGMYLLGVYAGAKSAGEMVNVSEALLHRDGFLKFFDPKTGEEVNGTQVKQLIETFYKK